MGACINGAEPTAAGLNTQQLLDKLSLVLSVATLFKNHAPTAYASVAASIIDINGLCQSNPDPPELFTAADFAALTEFTGSATVEYTSWAVAKITEWLKYQAFTQFCVCKVPAMDPTANCV